MSYEIDLFLQYLCEKYFVFHPMAELDEANTIDDIDILKRDLKMEKIKKVTDKDVINLCGDVLRQFKCYNIVSGALCDEMRISEDMSSDIYFHYKNYKCSSSTKTRETEMSLCIDNSLNTKHTYFVTSLEDITTDDLKGVFGNYICSGTKTDDFRYEYRFRFAKDGNVYTFSLYDYRDDMGEFYDEQDIFWHVASNIDKVDVVNSFVKMLQEKLTETCC